MYYELYIDILFLVNFMMDSLLLLTVRTLLKCPVPCWRVFLGGAAGAALTCVTVALALPVWMKYLSFYLIITGIMIVFGLRIHTIPLFFRACVILYLTAFLMGGIMQFVRPYVHMWSLYYLVAVISYYLIHASWKMITRLKEVQEKRCAVTLYTGSGRYHIQALADTGNVLRDPLSKQPVNVISKELAMDMWGQPEQYEEVKIRYIPYRTVSGTSVMPILKIERMCVHLEEDIWIADPVLGISEEKISENEEYQMLLNADIAGGIKDGCKSSSSTAV